VSRVPASELLLIRHAESTWNPQGRWQGHEDPPLSERGRAQAEALAQALAGAGAARVYASDLQRARATAELLAARLGCELRIDVRLRELDVGGWGGLTREEIVRRDAERLARFDAGDASVAAGGGESRAALRVRACAALRELARSEPDGCIALVTHLGWLREVAPGADFAHAEWRRVSARALEALRER
jgi:probable phosphoglycerate mutase